MIKYIKTEISSKLVESLLRRYLGLNKRYIVIRNKLTTYLNEKYQLNIYIIIDHLIKDIRVSRLKLDLVQVSIINEKIKDTTLQELLQLVEYGNRDIPPSRCINKLLNKSLLQVKDYLGGI